MKKLLTCLIITWTAVSSAAASEGLPTPEQIQSVMEAYPDLIIAMVQKLYVLERSEPVIEVPPLTIVETHDNKLVMGYEGVMTIDIGIAPNNLSYDVSLSPQEVVVATEPEDDATLPIWVWVAGAGVLFVGGFIVGVLVAH